MSTSSESSTHSTTRPALPANGDGSSDGADKLSNGQVRSTERRRRPQPSSPDQYLTALPASVLLDRLPVPMLATGLDGVVAYHNPAFATMLGHPADVTLIGHGLPTLLHGHSATPPRDCVATLRGASNIIVDWLHIEGFPVRSVVSETLLVRSTDEALLVGVTDITELIWTAPPEKR